MSSDPGTIPGPDAVPEPTRRKPSRLRRWIVGILILLAVALGIFSWLWFGGEPDVPGGPVRWVRGEDGWQIPEGGPERVADRSGVQLEVQAGKLAASNNFSSSSVTTRSGQARFTCRRVAIFNLSDHLLLQRAAADLLPLMKQIGYLEDLAYYPDGISSEEGQLAPDVVITLDMHKIDESVGLLDREIDATILIRAGTALAGCRSSSIDHLTPPVLRFDWEGKLHHRSTTTGVASGAAKYKLAAEDIAKQIAGTLKKQFDKWYEKDGPLPELSDAFYPAYRQPPALPLLEAYDTTRLTAHHGVMNHNETFWRLVADGDPADVLKHIEQQMQSAGWTTSSISTEQNRLPHLRMRREGAVLEVFPEEPAWRDLRPAPAGDDADRPPEPTRFCVHYLDRMTQEEVAKAVETTFAEDVPSEAFVLFESMWTKDQRRRALERLKSKGAKTLQTWLVLAKVYRGLKDDDAARDALLRAHVLLQTVGDQGDLRNQIRSLAKELGDEKLADKPIDAALIRELGFIELKPGVEISDSELGLDQPVHFFGHTADGELKTVSVRVVKELVPDGKALYQIAHVESFDHGRSWGKSGQIWEDVSQNHRMLPSYSSQLDGLGRVNFCIVKLPGKERFRLSAEVSPLSDGNGTTGGSP